MPTPSNTICQFYLRGQCRFGERCNNLHPAGQEGSQANGGASRFGSSTWNNNPPNNGVSFGTAASGSGTSGANAPGAPQLTFNEETMRRDLTDGVEKPLWPLSSYGPGKHEPNIIQALDESSEEMRVKFWEAKRNGQPQTYATYETTQMARAAQIIQDTKNNLRQKFAQAINLQPPAVQPSNTFGASTSAFGSSNGAPTPAFGATSFTSTSAFGVSSAPTSAFGASTSTGSAFGAAPSNSLVRPGTGAFGGPPASTSAFGSANPASAPQPAGGGFGQATAPNSAFGQTSAPTSAFGQPSTFGQMSSNAPTSAFGQTTAPTSAFGQTSAPTSAFGRTGFGQTSAPTTPSAFGRPSAPGVSSGSAFGQTGFGKPIPSAFGASTTGQTGFSGFANLSNAVPTSAPVASGVGQTGFSQPQSAFGQSGFGAAIAPTSAFGATTSAPTSAFGQPPAAAAPSSAFGQGSFSAFAQSTAPQAPTGPAAIGVYNPNADPNASLLPADYLSTLPQDVRAAFEADEFQWGQIPEWIPPMEVRGSLLR